MCSGRVDPIHVLEAFRSKADGVLVTGCHPGDCHYITGNYAAEKRVKFLKRFLREMGIESERLHLEWVSASEGARWAMLVKEMTQQVKSLGPSPLKSDDPNVQKRCLVKLDAAIEAFKAERVRWILGSLTAERVDQEKHAATLEKIVRDELERHMLLNEIRQRGPLTVKELSEESGLPTKQILYNLIALKKIGVVSVEGLKERQHLYKVAKMG